MENYERTRIEGLLGRDGELRLLWQQHLEFERELSVFEGRVQLGPEEQVARKDLQKRKLSGMDRIASIVARYEIS